MTDTQSTDAVKSDMTGAIERGIARANRDAAAAAIFKADERVLRKDVVTHAPPAHLTADYDPTHRPSALNRTATIAVTDRDALKIAEQMIATGEWRRCPDCGDHIATGRRIHAICELARKTPKTSLGGVA